MPHGPLPASAPLVSTPLLFPSRGSWWPEHHQTYAYNSNASSQLWRQAVPNDLLLSGRCASERVVATAAGMPHAWLTLVSALPAYLGENRTLGWTPLADVERRKNGAPRLATSHRAGCGSFGCSLACGRGVLRPLCLW